MGETAAGDWAKVNPPAFMAQARYASTVVLLRPDEDGSFEILLTRRPLGMKLLGGYYVFPGGTVHKDDYSERVLERCRGLSESDAQKLLGRRHEPELALGHWIAGIRELFEEVGILLCEAKSGEPIELRDETTKERFESKRKAIVREELEFGEFLESEELWCNLSLMIYFFHRVTPEIYSMRFDTRFYLAPLPLHQTPLPRSEEVTHSVWIKPAEALSRVYEQDFPILPPTTTVLEDLAEMGTWDELRAKYRLR
jgi:8-oxo-dGTP pyrophosphatase MutT (NUDIX family)